MMFRNKLAQMNNDGKGTLMTLKYVYFLDYEVKVSTGKQLFVPTHDMKPAITRSWNCGYPKGIVTNVIHFPSQKRRAPCVDISNTRRRLPLNHILIDLGQSFCLLLLQPVLSQCQLRS